MARRNAGVHYMGVLRRIGRYVPTIWPRAWMPDALALVLVACVKVREAK